MRASIRASVNSVAGSVSGNGWQNGDSDVSTISVKGAPPQGAPDLSHKSTKCGFMYKKNKANRWQKRFFAIVPRTYLYYFDGETSESAKGIVDLDVYNDIKPIEEQGRENVVYMGCSDNDRKRPFTFACDDPAEAAEWISALHRHRYFRVAEEMEAYQQLQTDFSEQMQRNSAELTERNNEVERLTWELVAERREKREALAAIAGLLARLHAQLTPDVDSNAGPSTATLPRHGGGEKLEKQTVKTGEPLTHGTPPLSSSFGSSGLEGRSISVGSTGSGGVVEAVVGACAVCDGAARDVLPAALEHLQQLLALAVGHTGAADAWGEEKARMLSEQERSASTVALLTRRVAELAEQKRVLVREVKKQRRASVGGVDGSPSSTAAAATAAAAPAAAAGGVGASVAAEAGTQRERRSSGNVTPLLLSPDADAQPCDRVVPPLALSPASSVSSRSSLTAAASRTPPTAALNASRPPAAAPRRDSDCDGDGDDGGAPDSNGNDAGGEKQQRKGFGSIFSPDVPRSDADSGYTAADDGVNGTGSVVGGGDGGGGSKRGALLSGAGAKLRLRGMNGWLAAGDSAGADVTTAAAGGGSGARRGSGAGAGLATATATASATFSSLASKLSRTGSSSDGGAGGAGGGGRSFGRSVSNASSGGGATGVARGGSVLGMMGLGGGGGGAGPALDGDELTRLGSGNLGTDSPRASEGLDMVVAQVRRELEEAEHQQQQQQQHGGAGGPPRKKSGQWQQQWARWQQQQQEEERERLSVTGSDGGGQRRTPVSDAQAEGRGGGDKGGGGGLGLRSLLSFRSPTARPGDNSPPRPPGNGNKLGGKAGRPAAVAGGSSGGASPRGAVGGGGSGRGSGSAGGRSPSVGSAAGLSWSGGDVVAAAADRLAASHHGSVDHGSSSGGRAQAPSSAPRPHPPPRFAALPASHRSDAGGGDAAQGAGGGGMPPLRCRRCSGTVEGPEFSTCKCAQPLLPGMEDEGTGGFRAVADKLKFGLTSMKQRKG